MNVLYACNFKMGGAEISLFELIKHIDKERYHPIVMLASGGQLKELFESVGVRVEIMDFDFSVSLKTYLRFILLNFKIIRFIRKNKISLIFINHHLILKFFFWPAKILRIPIVVRIVGILWLSVYEKFMISRCNRIICVSKAVKEYITRKRRSDIFIKINESEIRVLYSGRDTNRFDNYTDVNKAKSEFKIYDGVLTVGIVGSIEPNKGQDRFLKAAAEIIKVIPNTKFLIVGDSHFQRHLAYKNQIEKMTQELGLNDKVIFTGFRNDIPKIMKILDLLVVASTQEGLAGVLIEAMLAYKATVAFAVGGIPEVIDHNITGKLVWTKDPKDLAKASIEILKDKNLAVKMGVAGRRRTEELFDIRKISRTVELQFEEILDAAS